MKQHPARVVSIIKFFKLLYSSNLWFPLVRGNLLNLAPPTG